MTCTWCNVLPEQVDLVNDDQAYFSHVPQMFPCCLAWKMHHAESMLNIKIAVIAGCGKCQRMVCI